jgi:probable phosphoglycerate mutase
VTEVTELLLVRHGEAVANIEFLSRLDGVCSGLTERGRGQADLVGRRLAEASPGAFDVVCHSPVRRAVETTERILAVCARADLPAAEQIEDLRSADHGPAGQHPWDPATNRIGTIPPLDPEAEPNPGAESWQSYLGRSGRALLELAERHRGRRVLVVAHSETAASALHAFARLPAGASRYVFPIVNHTALTLWRRVPSGLAKAEPGGSWALMFANDDTHLPVPDRTWAHRPQ